MIESTCRPRPAPAAARTITRVDATALAVNATLTRYPFLLGLVKPRATIKRRRRAGWVVTVWFSEAAVYKRVAVHLDGRTRLLPSKL
jgi:hypothetical protein